MKTSLILLAAFLVSAQAALACPQLRKEYDCKDETGKHTVKLIPWNDEKDCSYEMIVPIELSPSSEIDTVVRLDATRSAEKKKTSLSNQMSVILDVTGEPAVFQSRQFEAQLTTHQGDPLIAKERISTPVTCKACQK